MTGHKHAALMLQYAQDAAETAEPWERWEYRPAGHSFWRSTKFLTWHPDCEYRRKPRTIRIGEFDVPEPLREAPTLDSAFYSPHLIGPNHFVTSIWDGTSWDRRLLSEGLVYPDEASAVLCARALLSLLEPRK